MKRATYEDVLNAPENRADLGRRAVGFASS
jgi:hypothetical protein